MSRLSIYETRWIDLVFENRNKEYGAYQLRHDSVKSSLTALFMGLLFVASIGAISTISSYLNPEIKPVTIIPEWEHDIIHVTDVDITPKTETTTHPQAQTQPTQALINQAVLRDPVIVNPNEASPDIPVNTEIKNTVNTSSDGTGATGNPSSAVGNGTETNPETTATDYATSVVTTAILDKMPEFPGGLDQFYKYVGNNFEKPEIEATGVIKIYVYFVIEKDGSMTDIKVIKDPGYGLGKEAIRVLKSLKAKWTPGMMNSKAVRTAYNLPISVRME
ncbi:MAG TPA: energy transducer TonB [Flavobacterium sp.]